MCLEVYAAQQPVVLPFAHEVVSFLSPTTFVGQYTVLVKNAGSAPLSEVGLLYPRPLLELDENGVPFLAGTSDLSPSVHAEAASGADPSKTLEEDQFVWRVANPNRPQNDLFLRGKLDPSNTSFSLPSGFEPKQVALLEELGVSAWTIQFNEPIAPNDAHWLSLAIKVDKVGRKIPRSISGPLVFHQFASPLAVRQTIEESFLTGKETVFGPDGNSSPAEHVDAFEFLLDAFSLRKPRQVQIEYYQLTVQPGDPMKQEMTELLCEGELWMRSDSPFPREVIDDGESWTEPVFQWKSGSMLDQFNGNGGTMDFTLRFALRLPASA